MSTDEEREFLGKRHLSFNSIAGWGGGGGLGGIGGFQREGESQRTGP
jgi:hypothetical protein